MSERVWDMNIVGHGEEDPRGLMPHPLNPKIHTPEQDAVVEGSLAYLGWLMSVTKNLETGRLLNGHERVALAIAHGEATVPVEYVRIPEEQEATALRILDPSGQLAQRHLERWAQLAVGAPEAPPVLEQFWAQLLAQEAAPAGGAGAPPAPEKEWQGSWSADRETQEAELAAQTEGVRQTWGVEPGQVWQCGRHVVWCGDSLRAAVEGALLAGPRVDLVVTSPPYAVDKAYEQTGGVDAHRQMIRDLGARCQAVVKPGGFVVVNFGEVWAQVMARPWTGRERACLYPMSTEYWQAWYGGLGWDLYAQRVWMKPFAKLRQPLWTYHTSLAHQQEWEWVWTWRLPGGEGEQVYDWDTSVHAVWDSRVQWVDPDGAGPWKHWSAGFPEFVPTQALKAHSAAGAVVWEPFLGGGTTLLACEALGRTCRGSDRDPGAVAVTLQRFSERTDTQPVRVA
jgi:DNA methylase